MKRFVTLLLISINAVTLANCQSTFQSLEEVWSYALKNNPDNEVYVLRIEKAMKDHKTANSYLYPKVYLGLSGQYNNEIPATPVPGEIFGMPGETVFAEFGQTYNYSRGLNISKPLFDWQSVFQAKIAKSNITLVKAEKALFHQNLRQQVAQVYYAALTALAAVELAQKDLILADSTLLLTTDKYKQGLIDSRVLNQVKINKNNAKDRLDKNKLYYLENEIALKILLGLTTNDTIILNEKIKLNELNVLDSVSPDVLSLDLYRIQLENSNFAAKQAKARFMPKLDIVSFWGSIQFQEDFKYSLNSSDWLLSRYIGLNLSVPLFTGFANKNQYRSAKISRDIAQLNYEEAKRKSSLNDNILYNNYLTSKQSVRTAEENLQLAGENVQLAYSNFSEGLISLDSYLSVYDDYLTVENQFLSSLSDYLINNATIQSRNN
jgi:outer membrane protein TolC